jgi:hypothetical protein
MELKDTPYTDAWVIVAHWMDWQCAGVRAIPVYRMCRTAGAALESCGASVSREG